jgi:hypothetical protein
MSELGMRFDIVEKVLTAGLIAFDDTSALAPRTSAGYNFYTAVVEQLREELIPLGWEQSDEQNFALIISPDKKIRIASCRGSEGTGKMVKGEEGPTTRSKRGPRTIASIQANSQRGQAAFGFFGEPIVGDTWFLLYYREGDVLFAELSLPGSFSHLTGRPDGWITRIILPRIMIGDVHDTNTIVDGPEYDYYLERRPKE